MSIVNLSSENKELGNDSEFEINLKRPLQRCIGVQILNVTVPLSYNIINAENKSVAFTLASHTIGARNGSYTATLKHGTYSAEDFAFEISNKMNEAAGFRVKSRKFYDLIADRKRMVIGINDDASDRQDNAVAHSESQISRSKLFPGMEIEDLAGNAGRMIVEYNSSSFAAVLTNDSDSTTVAAGTTTIAEANHGIRYHGIICIYDAEENCLRFASDAGTLAFGTNSTRMNKTLGFASGDATEASSGLSVSHPFKNLATNQLQCSNVPELSGPSMLYLRLGGDLILDQQNSETNMNDRIPIPIDQPHGGVVHYENDAESDVIPFGVPCDVRKLKIRLEYGDTNDIVGGATSNLRGHHVYVRLKFFKQHQQNGRKM